MMNESARNTPPYADPAQLERYAELIVAHGVNVQPGQLLQIASETIHKDLVLAIARKAYERGAKLVVTDLADPRHARLRIERTARDEDLDFLPRFVAARYDELVDEEAATLSLIGSEDPDLMEGVDAKRNNRVRMSRFKSLRRFYDEGINQLKVQWCVAAAATPAWGKKVYPGLAPDAACAALWRDILSMARADRPDCLALWDVHNAKLNARAAKLTSMGLDELRFTGPGTDLVVGLSPQYKFRGGGDKSTRGALFEPNIPTEEVFTTPDYRRTRGHVRATRPFLCNGTMVEGLELGFEGGVIKRLVASKGQEVFSEYTKSDAGASRLGEVALVGIDSPVYRSGKVFQEILFDENAACHIAVGRAYAYCLVGGEAMTDEEKAAVGCNDSSAHLDMMISSEAVDVTGRLRSGGEVPLLKGGSWVGDLA